MVILAHRVTLKEKWEFVEVGITVGNREEAYVKQAMIGASTEVVGLISLRKMGTSLPDLVGPLPD
jgi:DeoR/GlpR family transcriptional regulator of sugar metabolism